MNHELLSREVCAYKLRQCRLEQALPKYNRRRDLWNLASDIKRITLHTFPGLWKSCKGIETNKFCCLDCHREQTNGECSLPDILQIRGSLLVQMITIFHEWTEIVVPVQQTIELLNFLFRHWTNLAFQLI